MHFFAKKRLLHFVIIRIMCNFASNFENFNRHEEKFSILYMCSGIAFQLCS